MWNIDLVIVKFMLWLIRFINLNGFIWNLLVLCIIVLIDVGVLFCLFSMCNVFV